MKTLITLLILLVSPALLAQDFEITPKRITIASGRGHFIQDSVFNIVQIAGIPATARFVKLSVLSSTGTKLKGNPRTGVTFYHQFDESGAHYYVQSSAGESENEIIKVPLNADGSLRIKIAQFGGTTLGSGGTVTILGYSL